ncbi:hypothetical protein VIGAN_02244800, partial [Vigna angularis var. angularis]
SSVQKFILITIVLRSVVLRWLGLVPHMFYLTFTHSLTKQHLLFLSRTSESICHCVRVFLKISVARELILHHHRVSSLLSDSSFTRVSKQI